MTTQIPSIKISIKRCSSRNLSRGIRKREKINIPFVPLFPLCPLHRLNASSVKTFREQSFPFYFFPRLINRDTPLFPFKARGAKKLLW